MSFEVRCPDTLRGVSFEDYGIGYNCFGQSGWRGVEREARRNRMSYHDFGGALGLPEILEIEPTDTCNLRCRACHVSFMQHERTTFLDVALLSKLSALRGRYAIIGSVFEPIVHPRLLNILEFLSHQDCRIELLTNGTRLEESMVNGLASSNMYHIGFSFDGIQRETYEYIRRRANYESVLDGILRVRQRFEGRPTFFNLNYTMMRRNLEEFLAATEFWDTHGFDAMNFIFVVIRELEASVIHESLYPVRPEAFRRLDEVARHVIEEHRRITVRCPYFRVSPLRQRYPRNFEDVVVHSDHPGARVVPILRNEMQLGAFPGMPFPCRSPFVLARILANGDVQLCYKFVVGNLAQTSFEDIWFGEAAHRVRTGLLAADDTCRACDYYKFALKYNELDLDDRKTHFAAHTIAYAEVTDFEKGIVLTQIAPAPPRLVETVEQYNIVFYDRRYFGIPHAAGAVHVDSDAISKVDGLLVDGSLGRVRSAIKARQTGSGPQLVAAPPLLVESLEQYNIVLYDCRYFAIPQTAGPLHVDSDAIFEVDGLLVEGSLDRVRSAIRERKKYPIGSSTAS